MNYPKNQLEFERKFHSDAECKSYLFNLKFPGGFICPNCSGTQGWKQTRDRITCSRCLKEASLLSESIFQKSHVPLTLWFRAAWWMTNQKQGVSALGLQRALGLGSYRTAWLMLQKLRVAMVRQQRERLSGEVEVDEIWLGGTEDAYKKNRGNKQLILTAVEKNGSKIGRIRMKVIHETGGHVLLSGIQEMVEPGSSIDTDGWQGYMNIARHGYTHNRVVNPTARKALREADSLPRVHRVASLFKLGFRDLSRKSRL